MKIRSLLLVTSLLFSSFALATEKPDSKIYIGPMAGNVSTSFDNDDLELDALVLYGVAGIKVNPYLSLEARLGTSIASDDAIANNVVIDYNINHLVAGYIKAGFPINEKFYPYAMLGYNRLELEFKRGPVAISDSESDTSYAVGLEFHANRKVSIRAEFVSIYDQDMDEIAAFNIGAAINL